MTQQEFANLIKGLASQAGVDQYELYGQSGTSTEVSVFDGKQDHFSFDGDGGIGLRVIQGGHCGYASTQYLSKESARWLFDTAIQNAAISENNQIDPICPDVAKVDQVSPSPAASVTALTDQLLGAYHTAMQQDSRIKQIADCEAAQIYQTRFIATPNGMCADSIALAEGIVGPVAQQDGQAYNEYEIDYAADTDSLNLQNTAKRAVDKTLSFIGSTPVPSGSYSVLFNSETARSLLACFCPVFSGLAAMRKLSLLGDKLGQQIAFSGLNIIDAPTAPGSLLVRPFDDAGYPTYQKYVVQNGVLKTLLHNQRTANAMQQQNTANAGRGSYTSSIGVSPNNLYIQPGQYTTQQLMEQYQSLLYITGTKGLHAGANAATGDFSLECKGYLVQQGSIVRPVSGITMAGNFYTLLQNITHIGNTLQFSPPGSSCIGSPELLVSSLSIAGQ